MLLLYYSGVLSSLSEEPFQMRYCSRGFPSRHQTDAVLSSLR